MSLTITFTGAESVTQRRAALNAMVAYAAAFNDIGADAPDFGKTVFSHPVTASTHPLVQPEAAPAVIPPAAAVFTAPAQAAPEIELDSEGQPWNAELHASTKAVTADGKWRKKRGAPEAPAAAPVAPPEAPPAPAPAAVAPPAPAPAAPAAPAKTTFATFMANVMPLIKAGKIAGLRINELCQTQGVANMGMASSASADQLDTIWALIQAEPGVL